MTGKIDDVSPIIEQMIHYLDTHRSGTEISTMGILSKILSDFKLVYDKLPMFDLHERFTCEAERRGYILDLSKYENMIVGLPYSIPIVFRRPRKRGNRL